MRIINKSYLIQKTRGKTKKDNWESNFGCIALQEDGLIINIGDLRNKKTKNKKLRMFVHLGQIKHDEVKFQKGVKLDALKKIEITKDDFYYMKQSLYFIIDLNEEDKFLQVWVEGRKDKLRLDGGVLMEVL